MQLNPCYSQGKSLHKLQNAIKTQLALYLQHNKHIACALLNNNICILTENILPSCSFFTIYVATHVLQGPHGLWKPKPYAQPKTTLRPWARFGWDIKWARPSIKLPHPEGEDPKWNAICFHVLLIFRVWLSPLSQSSPMLSIQCGVQLATVFSLRYCALLARVISLLYIVFSSLMCSPLWCSHCLKRAFMEALTNFFVFMLQSSKFKGYGDVWLTIIHNIYRQWQWLTYYYRGQIVGFIYSITLANSST